MENQEKEDSYFDRCFTPKEYEKITKGTLTREDGEAINKRLGFTAVVFDEGEAEASSRARRKFSLIQLIRDEWDYKPSNLIAAFVVLFAVAVIIIKGF